MAVLAGNVIVGQTGPMLKIAVQCAAADKFYAGAIAWYDQSGGGSKLTVTPAAGDKVAGIVAHYKETLAADELVEIYIAGLVDFPAISNIDIADAGDLLIFDVSAAITDNYADCVTDATLAANDAVVGRIKNVYNSRVYVLLGDVTGYIYDATAAAFL